MLDDTTDYIKYRAHQSGRYILDPNGNPFPILGRATWGAQVIAATSDQNLYLTDCVNKGFTTLELAAPCTPDNVDTGLVTLNPAYPGDAFGNLPFLKQLDGTNWSAFQNTYTDINNQAPDLSTPNPAFWASIDSFLNAAAVKGLLVVFFPLYVGFQATHQGLMDEMVANGTTKCQTFGAFIGQRYINQPNLVWLLSGDRGTGSTVFDSGQKAVESAFIAGLQSVGKQRTVLYSALWGRNSIAQDNADWGTLLNLNPCYANITNINNQIARAYAIIPSQPNYIIEDQYDDETDATVIRQQWWAIVSGGGYMTGNNYVWSFDAGGTWKSHLSTGTQPDLVRLNAFVRSIKWWLLLPSFPSDASPLITSGGGTSITSSDYVASSVASDGSFMLAYIPPAHTGTITMKMTSLRGTSISRWFDRSNGTYTADASGLANTGTHTFTVPGSNSAGAADWVLRIDA